MATFSQTSVAAGSIYTGQPSTGVWILFNDAHNAPDGQVSQQPGTIQTNSVGSEAYAGRGFTQYRIARTFAWIDLSAYAPNITSFNFVFTGLSILQNPLDIVICQSNAFNNGTSPTLNPTDFDVNSAWNINNPYSQTQAFQVGTNVVQANTAAILNANTFGRINFVIIEGTYDFNNTSPGTASNIFTGEIDLTPAKIYVDGIYAAGYGNDVNGILSADIDEVNGIATGDIDSINGLS